MTKNIKIRVDCYSGHTAHERPAGFSIGETKFKVTDLMDRWYGPDYLYFKVLADDGNTYVIKYSETNDEWELEYFKKTHD